MIGLQVNIFNVIMQDNSFLLCRFCNLFGFLFCSSELRLARLALDPNNTPSWEVPELDFKPATKMPLFVGDNCITSTQPKTDVS